MTTIRAMKDKAYREALKHSGGNIAQAARALGVNESTLHRWKASCIMQGLGADSGGGETQ